MNEEVKSIKHVAAALAKAKTEFGDVVKGKEAEIRSTNKEGRQTSFKYSYENIAAIHEATLETLYNNKLLVIQKKSGDCNKLTISTKIVHFETGEEIDFGEQHAMYPKDRNGFVNTQDQGKTDTFLRRYALRFALDLAPVDESDGTKSADNDFDYKVTQEDLELKQKKLEHEQRLRETHTTYIQMAKSAVSLEKINGWRDVGMKNPTIVELRDMAPSLYDEVVNAWNEAEKRIKAAGSPQKTVDDYMRGGRNE